MRKYTNKRDNEWTIGLVVTISTSYYIDSDVFAFCYSYNILYTTKISRFAPTTDFLQQTRYYATKLTSMYNIIEI